MICFALAVNDTPKLAALLLVAPLVNLAWSAMIIGAVMAAGGLAYARRVAVTMSQRVTRIDHHQGLAANHCGTRPRGEQVGGCRYPPLT